MFLSTYDILFAWILFIVMELPLRYLFLKIGVGFLYYIKWLFLLFLFIVLFNKTVLSSKKSFYLWIIIAIAFYSILISLIYNRSPIYFLLTIFEVTPFLVGFLLGSNVFQDRMIKYMKILFIIVVLGGFVQLLSYFFNISLPWQTLKKVILQHTENAMITKHYLFGLIRISGFCSLFNVYANEVLLISTLIIFFERKFSKTMCLTFISFFALSISLVKSNILAFLFFVPFIYLWKYGNRLRIISLKSLAVVAILVILIWVSLPVALPFLVGKFSDNLYYNPFLGSFLYRISIGWKEFWKDIVRMDLFWFGFGPGSVTPLGRFFGENFLKLRYPVDNQFLIFFSVYGIFYFFVLLIILVSALKIIVSPKIGFSEESLNENIIVVSLILLNMIVFVGTFQNFDYFMHFLFGVVLSTLLRLNARWKNNYGKKTNFSWYKRLV